MKKILKNKKAITLIALVITIVVLVILAAVTISMTVGNDGLIARAIKAANDYKNSKIKEEQGINDLYGELLVASDGTIQNLTVDNLKEIVSQQIADETKELRDKVTLLENNQVSSEIFHGTVISNTMGASNTTTGVNQFTVTKSGKYVINYQARVKWLSESAFGVYVYKKANGTTTRNSIAYHNYSNKPVFNPGSMNVTSIQELNQGDVISVDIYQFNNGEAGVNNLLTNDLQLIRIGN